MAIVRINSKALRTHAAAAARQLFRAADRLQERIDSGEIPGATRSVPPHQRMAEAVRDVFGEVADAACPRWWDGMDSRLTTGQTRKIEAAIVKAIQRESTLRHLESDPRSYPWATEERAHDELGPDAEVSSCIARR